MFEAGSVRNGGICKLNVMAQTSVTIGWPSFAFDGCNKFTMGISAENVLQKQSIERLMNKINNNGA